VALMKLNFKSWRIVSIFGTFVWNNEEDLWYMSYFQPSHPYFLSPHLIDKFTFMLSVILILHNNLFFSCKNNLPKSLQTWPRATLERQCTMYGVNNLAKKELVYILWY
jgi:hypothetical protein